VTILKSRLNKTITEAVEGAHDWRIKEEQLGTRAKKETFRKSPAEERRRQELKQHFGIPA